MVSISTQTEDLPSAAAPATVLRGLLLDDWWAAEGDQPGAAEELGDEGSVEGLEGSRDTNTNEGEHEQAPLLEARAETEEVSVILQGWHEGVQPIETETGGARSAASIAFGTQPTPHHTSDQEALQSDASTQDSPVVLLGAAELEHERDSAPHSDGDLGAAMAELDSVLSPCPASAPLADKCEPVPATEPVTVSQDPLQQEHAVPAPSGSSQHSISALAPAAAMPVPERLDRSAGGSQPPLPGSEAAMPSSDPQPLRNDGEAVPRSTELQYKMPQTQTSALPIVQQRSSPRHLSKVLRGALTGLRNHRSANTAQRVFGTSSHVDSSPQQLWAPVAAESNVPVHSGGLAHGTASSTSQAEAAGLAVPRPSSLVSDPSSAVSPSEQQSLCQGRGRAEPLLSRGQEGQDGATASSFDFKSPRSADLPHAVSAGSPSGPSAGFGGVSQQREPLSASAPRPASDRPSPSRSSASLDKSTMTAVSKPLPPLSPSRSNDLDGEQSLPSVGSE